MILTEEDRQNESSLSNESLFVRLGCVLVLILSLAIAIIVVYFIFRLIY